MTIMTDAEWTEIARDSGLPDAARDEVSAETLILREDKGRDFEERSTFVRDQVDRTLALVEELSNVLGTLARSENYRCYNTGGVPLSVTPLEQGRDDLARLSARLDLDRERYKQKSKRDGLRLRTIASVRRLLEIQHQYLNTKLPVDAKRETSVRFRKYIKLCSGLPEYELDRILESVTSEFRRRPKKVRTATASLTERLSTQNLPNSESEKDAHSSRAKQKR
jgi:hypothetical protein